MNFQKKHKQENNHETTTRKKEKKTRTSSSSNVINSSPPPAFPPFPCWKQKWICFFSLPHASIGSIEEKILVASHVPARGVSCLFLCLLNLLRHGGRVTVDPLQTAEMVVEDLDDLRQLFFTISLAPFIIPKAKEKTYWVVRIRSLINRCASLINILNHSRKLLAHTL